MPEPRLGEVIVHNGLESTSTTSALSANCGRLLNEKCIDLDERVTALEEAGGGSGSDTTFTPATDAVIDALF